MYLRCWVESGGVFLVISLATNDACWGVAAGWIVLVLLQAIRGI